MEKYFGEKQERFSFRKLSVGLVSATISSLFFMSVLASSSVDAQETAGVHYKYVADSEKRSSLSMIFRHTWRMMMKLIILFIS